MPNDQITTLVPSPKDIHNERLKLMANTANSIGIALFLSGGAVPLLTILYGGEPPRSVLWPYYSAGAMFVALALHLIARLILGGLKNERS